MFTIAALYHFTRFPDPAALRAPLQQLAEAQGVKGSLLLAQEGINGTIAGTDNALASVLGHIRALPGCDGLDVKFSAAPEMPFHRMKVRLKREIVTMGEPDIDPTLSAGHYVDPHDWNALIADPETIVIDTRNDYEVALGTFRHAVDPQTHSFREFPEFVREHYDPAKHRKVAMFCTGGIRCEKASSFMLGEGYSEVYHLKGGILKYLETVKPEESLWEGECFVFDHRVGVTHGLAEGDSEMCFGCGHPVKPAERDLPDYEEGVSCQHCAATLSEDKRSRLRERMRQMTLARARGAEG